VAGGGKDETKELLALRAFLASREWKKLYEKVLLAAKPLANSTRLGPEDLVQNALMRIWTAAAAGTSPTWTPAEAPQFANYLKPILLSERANALKTAYNRRNLLARPRPSEDGEEEENEPQVAHPDGDALAVFERDRRVARGNRRTAAVDASLDELGKEVWDRMQSGTLDPKAMAAERGIEVKEIYKAQRRAAYHSNEAIEADPDSRPDPGSTPDGKHTPEPPDRS
jgi:DNA-directed RNA polymerase specialized sigma24 family protein